ncbi:Hypothetical predicted protein [Pelobates cultripes]|uniref:Uncharacterized protein n=1 Tax=Pelobates cultripes TaxID=61616 RepID=A0AAD1SWI2_PELCU|nr:Hypothetical predicted protein [Pelobates cultripes]
MEYTLCSSVSEDSSRQGSGQAFSFCCCTFQTAALDRGLVSLLVNAPLDRTALVNTRVGRTRASGYMFCMEPADHLTISESEVDRDLDPQWEISHRETGRNTEPPEDEVENLVAWANTLKKDPTINRLQWSQKILHQESPGKRQRSIEEEEEGGEEQTYREKRNKRRM